MLASLLTRFFLVILLCGASPPCGLGADALPSPTSSHRGATFNGSLVRAQTRSFSVICAAAHSVSDGAEVGKSFLLRRKRKIRSIRKDTSYFWRRRKDLNLRAGYPTYTLSRGASSPLEYFSMVKPYLLTHILYQHLSCLSSPFLKVLKIILFFRLFIYFSVPVYIINMLEQE